jgi:hypothetical protein
VALLLVLSSGAACTRYIQERQALIDFFEAARLRDTTVLGNMGTATFEPRTDGIVQQFDIDGVAARQPRNEGGRTIESKDVSVVAQVRTAAGETVPERLVVTFERPAGGRWLITQLRASRISRAASSAPPN